tara:strand:+ start:85 stop:273 length:189 start_codon:yes stop_codon:yes gene_type:complete
MISLIAIPHDFQVPTKTIIEYYRICEKGGKIVIPNLTIVVPLNTSTGTAFLSYKPDHKGVIH